MIFTIVGSMLPGIPHVCPWPHAINIHHWLRGSEGPALAVKMLSPMAVPVAMAAQHSVTTASPTPLDRSQRGPQHGLTVR